MANLVMMVDKNTGLKEKAYYGFSWTSLFFGVFPMLFRQEWKAFLVSFVIFLVISVLTYGIGVIIGCIVWAFVFNKWHLKKLIKSGYSFDEAEPSEAIAQAKQYIGMV